MEGELTDVATIIIGAEGALITLLCGVIGYFHVIDRKNQTDRMNKQDDTMSKLADFMRDQQEQINILAHRIDETIKVVETNQKNDSDRLQFMQQLILKRA